MMFNESRIKFINFLTIFSHVLLYFHTLEYIDEYILIISYITTYVISRIIILFYETYVFCSIYIVYCIISTMYNAKL